jgi:hypothetical protein
MWTPVNIDPRTTNIDDVLHIRGLSDIVAPHVDPTTYCNLNVCVNGLRKKIPNGYQRYILGFWFEIFDEIVFLETYNQNPTAEFLILTDQQANDLGNLDRVKIVNLFHWKWFLERSGTKSNTYKYKISSLSNRVNEFRAYITMKLLDRADVLVTWNATYMKDIDIDYVFCSSGRPKKDALLENIQRLKMPINQEDFVNDPQNSLYNFAHPAYSETLVNSINETKDLSWHADLGILPGPYMSEKTWKPLLNGNALLFTGQFNTCKTLTELGFQFDYPWSNNYDDLPGDLDRLELIFDTIDEILGMDYSEIENGIRNSVNHNCAYLNSAEIRYVIDQRNEHGLEQLRKIL